jgi:hypothetical protein
MGILDYAPTSKMGGDRNNGYIKNKRQQERNNGKGDLKNDIDGQGDRKFGSVKEDQLWRHETYGVRAGGADEI